MTSDTKIGLLLGLVFIFVVAFLINGLPGFCSSGSTNEMTYNTAGYNVENPGLATLERQIGDRIDLGNVHWRGSQRRTENQVASTNSLDTDESQLRAVAPLPKPISDQSLRNAEVVLLEATTEKKTRNTPVKQDVQAQAPSAADARPMQYVVQAGDTLATIAQQHYGANVGNRLATIDMLFTANQGILSSRHELKIGQYLTIPVIPEALRDVTVPVTRMGSAERNTPAKPPKFNKIYEVRDGDSLWKIAVVCLGNGNRYPEIKRLNQDLLPDENSLSAGMRLRLPTP